MTWPALALPLVTMHTHSPQAIGTELATAAGKLSTAASAVYPTANLALFIPFWLGTSHTAVQLFCWNGATVSGNIDVGIYAADGTKLVSSGSTAQAGVNVLQAFDIADTVLGPGNYYLAVAMDNTTGTLFRLNIANRTVSGFGCLQQASAFALPAVATFAAYTTSYQPVIGFSTRAVL